MHPVVSDRRGLTLYLLAWLLLGMLLALPAVEAPVEAWRSALLLFLPPYLLYAFLGLAAWYPCRANPIAETSIARVAAVHLTAGAAASLAWWLAVGLWASWLHGSLGSAALGGLQPAPAIHLALGVLLYLLAATVHYLLLAAESSRRARQRTLELRVLAREAELAAFKSQIDPHFLFNCLNSISSLCGSDPTAARQMSIRLGEFLRSTLRLAAQDLIPLAKEIELARAYLEIEQVRFGERLEFTESIEPEATKRPVPALIVQPLLENAIKHGLAHLVNGGTISLSAAVRGGRLHVEISNPVDAGAPSWPGDGIGLANVRGRLDLLYSGDGRLEIERAPERFRARLDLPEGGDPRKEAGR